MAAKAEAAKSEVRWLPSMEGQRKMRKPGQNFSSIEEQKQAEAAAKAKAEEEASIKEANAAEARKQLLEALEECCERELLWNMLGSMARAVVIRFPTRYAMKSKLLLLTCVVLLSAFILSEELLIEDASFQPEDLLASDQIGFSAALLGHEDGEVAKLMEYQPPRVGVGMPRSVFVGAFRTKTTEKASRVYSLAVTLLGVADLGASIRLAVSLLQLDPVFVDNFASRRQAHEERPSAPSIFGGESIYETIRWYQLPAREYSRRELIADRLVNFGGVGLAVLAAPILALRSRTGGDPAVKQIGLWIHAFCMILMFTCSAFFHYWAWDERNQRFLLMLDHIGINSMIAGCYTPVMIHCRCYRMLAFVWTCAVIGFCGEISLYSIWRQTMQDLEDIESTLHAGGADLLFHPARYLMSLGACKASKKILKAFAKGKNLSAFCKKKRNRQ
ncbi:unnamed protein product [Cladocopium goreaui]|uniref:Nipped-B-like protein B n=1 Tax=Cladocopium goreaui TaxID=2562237 RepID=A0A9P1FF57_9DINO|nr:unnamed protein product [Cladocopium goreaui]